MNQFFLKIFLRFSIDIVLLTINFLNIFVPTRNVSSGKKIDILLTGTFYAENWILAHIKPLADSDLCNRIIVVSHTPIPQIQKVTNVYPSKILVKIFGNVAARIITFTLLAIRYRPQFIGGFHLLFNGLVSILLSRLLGVYSLYFCVGGPTETLHGGQGENRIFGKLQNPDAKITNKLVSVVSKGDITITMGHKAAEYFREKGVSSDIYVVSGGIDSTKFHPAEQNRQYDLILVARLSTVKKIDLFLEIVKKLSEKDPKIAAVIVGDGPLSDELREIASKLKINDNVHFVGYKEDVHIWLKKSKIFVLTSSSEGLALAMMEAMRCGLPAVVPNVGDLGELITNGVNGFLIDNHCIDTFSEKIQYLLSDEKNLQDFSTQALESSKKYRVENVTEQWNYILSSKNTSSLVPK